jgi:hypothetical protein
VKGVASSVVPYPPITVDSMVSMSDVYDVRELRSWCSRVTEIVCVTYVQRQAVWYEPTYEQIHLISVLQCCKSGVRVVVIVVLQWCYSGVTASCCVMPLRLNTYNTISNPPDTSSVTVVSQWCHSGVTVVLQ